MEKHHIQVCGIEDSNYPRLLKHCADAPLVLFYKGESRRLRHEEYCHRGDPQSDRSGKKRVDTLLHELAGAGYHPNIISGLAYGIDITAHTACVHYGLKAQAVLGHGLHMVYPASQKHGRKDSGARRRFNFRISDLRADFTDKLPSTQSNRGRHERGDPCCRIPSQRRSHVYRPAGLVVQPGRDGDSRKAGRPYLQRVQPVDQTKYCRLSRKRQGLAPNFLNWPPLPTEPYQMSLDLFPVTNNEVLTHGDSGKMGEQNIDQLHQLTRIPVHDLSVLLLKLELEGRVMQLPGNCYTLI